MPQGARRGGEESPDLAHYAAGMADDAISDKTVADEGWPGRRFGCASTGRTSVVRLVPRALALIIDWALCSVIASALLGYRWGGQGNSGFEPLLIFAIENVVLIGTLGSTIGQFVVGGRVTRLDGSAAGPVAAVIRTALLCVVIPAIIFDVDQRGLHDRLAKTILVKTR